MRPAAATALTLLAVVLVASAAPAAAMTNHLKSKQSDLEPAANALPRNRVFHNYNHFHNPVRSRQPGTRLRLRTGTPRPRIKRSRAPR